MRYSKAVPYYYSFPLINILKNHYGLDTFIEITIINKNHAYLHFITNQYLQRSSNIQIVWLD